MKAPRNNLCRSASFELGEHTDGMTLEGYAAVFDSPTRIDSWEGTFDEIVARGAFRSSINNATPVLQFDHGRDPATGTLPIGEIEDLREDDHGLFVRARLNGDDYRIPPIRNAIKSGAVDGMSFRFRVDSDTWADGAKGQPPTRTIREATVFELGPVVFPAYAATSVGVRTQLAALEPDERLRLLDEIRAALDVRDDGVGTPTLDVCGDGVIREARSRRLRLLEIERLMHHA